jgi:hypothetical protein
MLNTSEWYQTASGPIVIVGNGPSLADIPDSFLNKYPTFGANTIHMRQGFKPTYYAVADDWIKGLWDQIYKVYADVPKFCLDRMPSLQDGEWDVYPYHRKDGAVWLNPKELNPYYLQEPGIAFRGIPHVMIQIALFMGYDKFYLVGCDNTAGGEHFHQEKFQDYEIDVDLWEWAFNTLQTCLIPKPIINLSTRGTIHCLPWADWSNL